MNRIVYLFTGLLLMLSVTGCTVTEADKHAVGMEVVKQTIRSAFHFGTSAALKSIR